MKVGRRVNHSSRRYDRNVALASVNESQSESDGLRAASARICEAYAPLLDAYDVAHDQPPFVHPFIAAKAAADVEPRRDKSVEYEKKLIGPGRSAGGFTGTDSLRRCAFPLCLSSASRPLSLILPLVREA